MVRRPAKTNCAPSTACAKFTEFGEYSSTRQNERFGWSSTLHASRQMPWLDSCAKLEWMFGNAWRWRRASAKKGDGGGFAPKLRRNARGAQENLWPKSFWNAPLRATSSGT